MSARTQLTDELAVGSFLEELDHALSALAARVDTPTPFVHDEHDPESVATRIVEYLA